SGQRSPRSRHLLPSPGRAPTLYRHRPRGELGGWWAPSFPMPRCLLQRRLCWPDVDVGHSADGFRPVEANPVRQGGVMSERSGLFWDVFEGRASLPPAAATLGLEFIDADGDAGTVELAFEGIEDFTNPAGNVLGGFQAAMLWETVGAALLATHEPDQFQSTT